MTEQEQTELNGRIADSLFGWDLRENGMWADPTGDEYKLPPNYSDNSGLVVGLEYKLRKRGFIVKMRWDENFCRYKLTKGEGLPEYIGEGDTKSLAMCIAVRAMLDANAL